jgi:preprotein translocase subunit SecE
MATTGAMYFFYPIYKFPVDLRDQYVYKSISLLDLPGKVVQFCTRISGILMSALAFIKEVKSEAKKVSWPTRKESLGATGLVVVVSMVFALFFLLVDTVVHSIIQFILGA